MKTFIETYKEIEGEYVDAVRLGFIAGLGVLLVVFALFISRQNKNLEDYRTTKYLEVLDRAEEVCPKSSDFINITDIDGEWQIECGRM